MGIYEGIKDVAKVVQQADNIELYKKLLDIGAQALDMQEEISRLKEENRELRKGRDLEDRIVRHQSAYITLKNDTTDTRYCSHCWDNEHKIMQLNPEEYGYFRCSHCKNRGKYDDAATYRSIFG